MWKLMSVWLGIGLFLTFAVAIGAVHACSVTQSCLNLCDLPWTPLSMGFSRQEYWSGFPFASPGDLHNPGIEPGSFLIAGRFFTTEPPGKPKDRHHILGKLHLFGTPTGNMAFWDYNSYECPWKGINFLHKVNRMKHNCWDIQISPSKFQTSKLIELL